MILSSTERNRDAVPNAAPTLRTIDPTRSRSCIFNSLGTEPIGSGPSGRLLTSQAGRNITAIGLPFKLKNIPVLSCEDDRKKGSCRGESYLVAGASNRARRRYIPGPMTPGTGSKISRRLRDPLSLSIVLLALGAAACGRGDTPPGGGPSAPPGVATAPVGGPGGHFVGSDACRDCHAAEFAGWTGSRHKSTLRPWKGGDPLPLFQAKLEAPYYLSPDGTVEGPSSGAGAAHGRIAYRFGGRHREELAVRLDDGRLQLFPIAYDVDRHASFEPLRELAGGASPPPDTVDFWTRVGRNVDLACYGCHATGQVVVSEGVSPEGLVLPGSRWIEPGVGCEACHGPGGAHVEAARAGHAATVRTALAGAAPAAIVDACAACHGLREILPSPFSADPAHRDGAPLYQAADPLLSVGSNFEFREPFFGDLRPATYQQEAIAFSQSGCARKGGLTCSRCHDPHSGSPTSAVAGADGGDGLCASCHSAQAALGERHTLHAAGRPGGRCLDCHMATIVRGPASVAARDHTMAPPTAVAGTIPAACVSCHTDASAVREVAEAWQRVKEGPAARRRRETGEAIDGVETPKGLAALERIVLDADRGWFQRWASLQRIAGASTVRRDDVLAGALTGALADPNPALRRAAARAFGRFGRPTDFPALEKALEDRDPWTALAAAQALVALGAPSADAKLSGLLLRSDLVTDARMQYAFGHSRVLARDWDHAEPALRRAIELHPMMVGTISDLGVCLRAKGKKEEAEAAWRRALAINPRFTSARINLAGNAEPDPAPGGPGH